jgi:outer membrane protein assembly factor BamE (lipoprotein component of BamABCDE complex)
MQHSERVLLGCIVLPLAFLFLSCCLLPQVTFRLYYGRGPLQDNIFLARRGMTPEEVIEAIGPPHKTAEGDKDTWIYFEDSLGWHYCCVQFGEDGLVHHAWVH